MKKSLSSGVRPVISWLHWIFLIAFVLAGIAGFQLFALAEHTDRYFAWTISIPLTAAFAGASYWAAAVLAAVAFFEGAWANVRIALSAYLTFLPLILLATLLHLSIFHLESPVPLTLFTAWAWLIIYIVLLPVMLFLLILQLRTPGGDPPRILPMAGWVRLLFGLQAALMLSIGVVLYLDPALAQMLWPWQLTPLTARLVASWLLGLGVGAVFVVRENDWRRARGAAISYLILAILQGIALVLYGAVLDWTRPATWLYLLFLVSVLVVGGHGSYVAFLAPRQQVRRQVVRSN